MPLSYAKTGGDGTPIAALNDPLECWNVAQRVFAHHPGYVLLLRSQKGFSLRRVEMVWKRCS